MQIEWKQACLIIRISACCPGLHFIGRTWTKNPAISVQVHPLSEGPGPEYRQYEVDFIATDGNVKHYIQSAYEIENEEKREQELKSLKRIDDSFQKTVIVKDDIMSYRDNNGILFVGLFQFLSAQKSLG